VKSLRNRLTLIFGGIVLGAMAVVYFSVIPLLEERLVAQKLERLSADARRHAPDLAEVAGTSRPRKVVDARVRQAAAGASAEAMVLGVDRGTITSLYRYADSSVGAGVELVDVEMLALDALKTGRTTTGTEPSRAGRQAVAATPLRQGRAEAEYVLVLADSLSDVQDNVLVIRRTMLGAAALAVLLAAFAGALVASRLAGRVKRLERAARKVAAGEFSTRITVDSEDELGQLAAAFDDMQHQLARLDTARKQFIASASHELRTPIFSLGGFLELLEDEELDEETRAEFVHQVRGQVERLRVLATELLDLSRLESGAVELRPEPTDLSQLARDVAQEFTPAIQRDGARLDVALGDDPIEAECDPERVAQVLRILLDNAIAHTPSGTPITVSAGRVDGHVRLEVADRGLGIKRQVMPHLFEPFFTASDHARGAGLGLAIAHELAGTMQGELHVRSAPGQTSFSLVLPA
jgi:signal transduction histidine kinase